MKTPPQHKRQNEDNHFQTQFKKAFDGFFKEPQTMKELSISTGIDRANVCRYCREMRKTGTIKYTTNPEQFPTLSQLKLF